MTYEEWTKRLKEHKDPYYYENMIQFSADIVEDLRTTKAWAVAEKLNISPQRLSHLKPILTALAKGTSSHDTDSRQ